VVYHLLGIIRIRAHCASDLAPQAEFSFKR